MKKLPVCLHLFWTVAASAATSANYGTSPGNVDTGGTRVASANYSIEGSSVGGVGGISASANYATRHGYSGQLFEVTNLTINAVSSNLNETASVALNPQASLSDGTKLSPAVLQWFSGGAIAAVSPTGLVTAAAVYTNLPGMVVGGLGNLGVTRSFWVLDTHPDNYGLYAYDNIPDSWQVQFFGANNPAGTGSDVLFKYTAGLNPTNPASVFSVSLATAVAGQAQIRFSPRLTNRTYTVQYTTDLASGNYYALPSLAQNDNGDVRTVTDLSATNASRFYRVGITFP